MCCPHDHMVFGPMRGVFCKPQSLRFDVQNIFWIYWYLAWGHCLGTSIFLPPERLLTGPGRVACGFFVFLGSPVTPQTQGLRAGRHSGHFFFVISSFPPPVLGGVFALFFFSGFVNLCISRFETLRLLRV